MITNNSANITRKKQHVYIYTYMYMYIYTRIIKNIFNKNERRCRDVKTQKACEQGWEANIGPEIKQTTSI